MNLNKDDVLLLINEYQKQRILWDPKDKWHFHKNKKNDAWEEIARCVDIDVEGAKKKMSSLLGSFRREKAKGRQTVGTGKGAKDIYKSDWFAFKSFGFLMDKDEPRETISSENLNVVRNEGETIESGEISMSSEATVENTESQDLYGIKQNLDFTECSSKRKGTTEGTDNTEVEPLIQSSFRKPSTPKRKRKILTEKEDPRIEQAYKVLQQPIPQETSSSIYAKYLADRLDKFDPVTQAVLKHKIDQLIFDAEMEKYRAQNTCHGAPHMGHSFTSTPSPTTPLSSPRSTPPFSREILCPNDFEHESTLTVTSDTSSDTIQSELAEFVQLTQL